MQYTLLKANRSTYEVELEVLNQYQISRLIHDKSQSSYDITIIIDYKYQSTVFSFHSLMAKAYKTDPTMK